MNGKEQLNNFIISQTSLRDSIFTKDNIKYNILIKFPDGSTLKNFNDDQYPVIPFCLDEDSIKNDIDLQRMLKSENNKDLIIDKIIKKFLKNDNKIENYINKNNEFNFQNKSIELKDKIFVNQNQDDNIHDNQREKNGGDDNNNKINTIEKEINSPNEKNNDGNKVNNIGDMEKEKEKEKEKEMNDIYLDSLEISKKFNNEKNTEENHLLIENNNKFSSNNKNNESESNTKLKKEINKENDLNFSENNCKSNNGNVEKEDKEIKEDKETNTEFLNNENIQNQKILEKKNIKIQTIDEEIESLKDQKNKENQNRDIIIENNIEKSEENNDNKEFFENNLKNDWQTLDRERDNQNNKKIRKIEKHNEKIINNENILVKKQNIKEIKQKKKLLNEKKRLNKILLEREMNEIKKKLQRKKDQQQKKESEKTRNDYIQVKKRDNKKISNKNENLFIKNISKDKGLKREERREKFNIPSKNDICSKLLQASIENEKQLYLIPYAKKKEKINKTFNTIGNSNGISYSEYSVIKGIEIGNNSYINIIRDDDRKNSSRKCSEIGSSRKSTYTYRNKVFDTNEFKF